MKTPDMLLSAARAVIDGITASVSEGRAFLEAHLEELNDPIQKGLAMDMFSKVRGLCLSLSLSLSPSPFSFSLFAFNLHPPHTLPCVQKRCSRR